MAEGSAAEMVALKNVTVAVDEDKVPVPHKPENAADKRGPLVSSTTFEKNLEALERHWEFFTLIFVILCAMAGGAVVTYFTKALQFAGGIYAALAKGYSYAVLLTPVGYFFIVLICGRFAPEAKSSGVPFSKMCVSHTGDQLIKNSFNLRTLIVKLILVPVTALVGGTIGSEGPSAQVSACTFMIIVAVTNHFIKGVKSDSFLGGKLQKLKLAVNADLTLFLVVGSAAGIAAAFNTPIAGIIFAIEELGGYFSESLGISGFASCTASTIVAVIIKGEFRSWFSAVGAYDVTFTDPFDPSDLTSALLGGVVGGVLSSIFVVTFLYARKLFDRILRPTPVFQKHSVLVYAAFAGVCGAIHAGIQTINNHYLDDQSLVSGDGRELTYTYIDPEPRDFRFNFMYGPLLGISSWLTFMSGVPGGIFAPAISTGANYGFTLTKLMGYEHGGVQGETLLLCTTAGYFAGLTQAPLTACVVLWSMANDNNTLIWMMMSAFIATCIAKAISPESLYHVLAHNLGQHLQPQSQR